MEPWYFVEVVNKVGDGAMAITFSVLIQSWSNNRIFHNPIHCSGLVVRSCHFDITACAEAGFPLMEANFKHQGAAE